MAIAHAIFTEHLTHILRDIIRNRQTGLLSIDPMKGREASKEKFSLKTVMQSLHGLHTSGGRQHWHGL